MPEQHQGHADRLVEAWVRQVVAAPGRTLLALGLLTALSIAATLVFLRVDSDSSRLLAPDLPFQVRAHALNAAFPDLKTAILVVVEAPGPDAADAVAGALTLALGARPEVAEVFAPSVDPYLVSHGLLYRDTAAVDRSLTELSAASNLLAALRADQTVAGFLAALDQAGALAEEGSAGTAGLDRLHAEAASVWAAVRAGEARAFAWTDALGEPRADGAQAAPVRRVITVRPRLDPARLSPARPALDAIEAAIAGLDPGLAAEARIAVTGEPALRAEELRSVTSTIGISFASSLLLVGLILWIALRTARRALLAVALLVAIVALVTGFAASAGPLNLISIAFIVLMTGMGEDFLVHLMLDIEARVEAGLDAAAAAIATAGELGGSMLLAAGTTSAAFLAFTATDFVGMAQLGLIGGVGVLMACAVALTAIPAAVALRPGLARARSRPPGRPRRAPSRRAVLLLGLAGLVVSILAGVVARDARFDADPINLRDPDAPSVVAFRRIAADPGLTPYRMSVLTPDATEAARVAGALAAVPEVARAVWLGDLIPPDQGAKLDLIDLAYPSIAFAVSGAPVALEAPLSPEAVRARLLARLDAAGGSAAALAAELRAGDPPGLRDALFRHFPAFVARLGATLSAGEVTVGTLPAPLTGRFLAADGRYRVDVTPRDDMADPAALARFVAAVAAVAPGAAGAPDQIAGATRVVGGAMLSATTLAALAAGVLVWLATRRRIELVAVMVPLVAAGAITAAFGVLADVPFNYANIIVAPLLIGLGIDSAVYLAHAGRAGPAALFAGPAPRAVVFSVATTIAAFGTLAFSDHRGTASMGILLTVALTATLVASFSLTPAILALGAGRRSGGMAPPG